MINGGKYEIKLHDGERRLISTRTNTPIPADEPVFILRARDNLAYEVICHYLDICRDEQVLEEHLSAVNERIDAFRKWQKANPAKMKQPGMPG